MSEMFSSPDLFLVIEDFRLFLATQKVSASQVPLFCTALFAFLSQQVRTQSSSLEEMGTVSQAVFLDTVTSPDVDEQTGRNIYHAWQAYCQTRFAPPASSGPTTSSEDFITRYQVALKKRDCSDSTIKNYSADLRSFFEYFENRNLNEFLTKPNVLSYFEHLKSSGLSDMSVERKQTSLRQFFSWAIHKGYILDNPLQLEEKAPITPITYVTPRVVTAKIPVPAALSKFAIAIGNTRVGKKAKRVYDSYHALRFTSYLHSALLIVFTILLTFGGFRQFFSNVLQSSAFPTSLTRPSRTLSFQARLTDAASTPITSSSNLVFKLYDAASSGVQLWTSGTCAITPDSDGIFSTLLGSSCGSEIASSVFSENQQVWLEVTVGAETLTPRQQIATVGYALNSETLQGYPASASAMPNTIPVMNNSGVITLGWGASTIQSTLGTFALKGNALSIVTNTGTAGNITIAPDGTGQVSVLGSTTSTDTFTVSNANLTTGNLITGSVGNNNTGYNLLSLQSGSSPTTKFSVDALGNVTEKGYFSAPGATISATYSTATPLIINGTGGQIFSIANSGNITAAGTLTGLTGLTSSGTITFSSLGSGIARLTSGVLSASSVDLATSDVTGVLTLAMGGTSKNLTAVNGGIVWTDTDSMEVLAAGVGGQCLTSGGAGTPSWASCAGASGSYWQLDTTSKVLSPGNSTWDLAVGGNATSSALFQVFGASGNATTSGNFTFAGGSTPNLIAARNKAGLTIGDSQTGNIIFNGGNVGILNLNPTAALDVTGTASVSSTLTLGGALQPSNGPLTLNYKSGLNSWATGLTIDTVGNVGIGTSVPTEKLELTGTSNTLFRITPSVGSYAQIYAKSSSSSTGDFYLTNQNTGNLYLRTSASFGNATTALTINNVGNVGIGTTSPSSKVDIQGGYLNVSGGATISATYSTSVPLSINGTGGLVYSIDNSGNASQSGNLTLGNGSVIKSAYGPLALQYKSATNAWTTGITLQDTTGDVSIANLTTAYGIVYTSNATGKLAVSGQGAGGECLVSGGAGTPTWGSCGSGTNYWQLDSTLKVLSPGNSTWDLAVGGNATSSALFQVFGASGNATTSGNFTFAGGATPNLIAARNKAGLTIGDSQTGNIIFNGGNVGILNLNPTATLDVTGTASISSTLTLGGVLRPSADALTLQYKSAINTWATGLILQPTTGYVGIGTSNPFRPLSVVRTSGGSTVSTLELGNYSATNNSGSRIAFNFNGSGGNDTHAAIDAVRSNAGTSGDTYLAFTTRAGATAGERLRIDPAGNIGIGTTSPTALLHVNGGYGSNAALIVNNLNSGDLISASASGTTKFRVQNDGTITDAAYISCGVINSDSSGNLGCGSATNYWQLNNNVLAPGNAAAYDLAIGGNSTSSAKFQVFASTGSATTSGSLTFAGTSATNLIAARNKAGLTIGDSQTGNIIFNGGNVGILNLNPTAALDITGTASVSSTLTLGGALQPSTGPLTLNYKSGPNAWAAALTIDTVGNVGIGTTTPTAKLHVLGAMTQSGGAVSMNDSSNNTVSIAGGTSTGTVTVGGTGTQTISLGNGAGAKTVNLGSSNTTSTTTIQGGSSGILLNNSNFLSGVSIGTSTVLAPLYVKSGLGSNAAFIVDNLNSGDLISASSSGTTKFTVGNTGAITDSLYASCTGITSNSSGLLACNQNAFADINYWQLNNKVISPGNSTHDLAIGGNATSSALFQVFGASGNATTSGNFTFAGGATPNLIAARNKAGLTIGDSQTGNIIFNGGNVGILNLNPTATLDVTGTASISGNLTIGNGSAIQSAYGPLTLNYKSGPNSWAAGFTLASVTGNVGIGTTAPTALLHVNGGYGANAALIINQTNTADIISASASGTTRFRVDNSGNVIASSFLDSANNSYYLDPANAGTSLTLAGQAGIGTASPTSMLHVNGGVNGKALTILNQTNDQDILAASASGVSRATITNNGDYKMYGPKSQATIASINDTFVYDTTSDSDGGQWTNSDKAKSSSWYNETMDNTGNACGISIDDRCGDRSFPKRATIVADASNVRIYDAETQTMWMRFSQGTTALGADSDNDPQTIYALNGRIYIGTSGSSATGLYVIDMKADTIRRYDSTSRAIFTPTAGGTDNGGISGRNAYATFVTENTIMKLPSSVINDVKAANITGQDYVAVATNGSATGSVSLFQEETRKIGNFGHAATAIVSKNVFLTIDGTLYYTYRDQNSAVNDKLKVNYAAHKQLPLNADINSRDLIPADVIYGNISSTNYGVAFGDATNLATAATPIDFQPGPTFPTTTPVVNDLFVTKGTSTADGRSNTIYMADDAAGVIRIDEAQSRLSLSDRIGNRYTNLGYPINEQNGSVKYYTKDYVTENMPGDVRALWGFNPSFTLSDVSIKANTLTNNNSVTFTANGIRGTSATFTAASSMSLSSTATNLLPTAGISVGAWVNPTSITGNNVILAKSGDITNKGYRLYLNAGKPTFEVSENGTDVYTVADVNAITASTWNHIVGVFSPGDRNAADSRYLDLYVNGIKVAHSDNAPNMLYRTRVAFRVGNDDQNHTNVAGTALDATFKIITGPNSTQFQVGDFINVYNSTTTTPTQTSVTATSTTTITVLDVVGTGTGDQTVTSKMSYLNPTFATGNNSATVNQGPTQKDYSIGDLVEVYDKTGTASKQQTVISAVSATTVTALAAHASNAVGDDRNIVKLNSNRPAFGTALDATFKIITGQANSNEYAVGDAVQVSKVAKGGAAPTSSTFSVITAVSSTTITTLNAIGAVTTDDTWTVKMNSSAPVTGTALDATFKIITGPTNAQFSIGDLVEVYNSSVPSKTQTTVTAISGSTITVKDAVGTGTGNQTKVAKLSTETTPTEFLDAKLDDAFVSASVLTDSQVKTMFETGLAASQNHTASRITGITGANTYQQLAGAGTAGATVNRATTIAVDDQNQTLYVGTNDNSAATGGVSVMGATSDTLLDLYDHVNNTAKKSDAGTQFDATDVVALSIHGSMPKYLSIAGTNDTTTKLWMENSDVSLKTLFSNTFNPFGATLEQTNLKIDGKLVLGTAGQVTITTTGQDVTLTGNLKIAGNTILGGLLIPNSTRPIARYLFTGSTSVGGKYVSMVLGADDLPRLVQYDSTLFTLSYIRCLNQLCSSYTSQTIDNDDAAVVNANVGNRAVITMGPNNLPYIAYADTTDGNLKYIRCLDQDCENRVTRIIDGGNTVGSLNISMKVTSQGNPVFVYNDATAVKNAFAYCNDMDCNNVVTHIFGQSSAHIPQDAVLALTSTDLPIIAYHLATAEDVYVINCSTTDCQSYTTTAVVTTNSVGSDLSIAMGTDDFPRIVYHDVTVADKYVLLKCTTASCSSNTALTINSTVSTTAGAQGAHTSIVMDSSNNSYVAYYDSTNGGGRLKFAKIDNTPAISGAVVIVDDPADAVGDNPWIALTSGGIPYIAYSDTTVTATRLNLCANSGCTSNASSFPLNIFSHFNNVNNTNSQLIGEDMVIGNDNLARMVYYDATNLDLYYLRCLNLTCAGMVTTLVDSSGDVGLDPRLAMGKDGFARIVYRDETNNKLKFAQCTNDNCTTSNITTPDVTVISVSTGLGSSIVIGKDGFARIISYDTTNFRTFFVRCLNAACTSFHANILTNRGSQAAHARSSAIILDPNDLAIGLTSTYLGPNGYLTYTHCTDLDCTKTDNGTNGTALTTDASSLGTHGGLHMIWNPLTNAPSIISSRFSANFIKFIGCLDVKTCSSNVGTDLNGNSTHAAYGLAIDPNDQLPIVFMRNGNVSTTQINVHKCTDAYCKTQGASTGYNLGVPFAAVGDGVAAIRTVDGQTQYVFSVQDGTNLIHAVATATTNIGNIDHTFGSLFVNTVIAKQTTIAGFDLAEHYPSTDDLSPGEVVAMDPTVMSDPAFVRKASVPYDNKLIGIVSTEPGITLKDPDSKQKSFPIALTGRVPVKVSLENGPILKGDYLTAATTPGYAMKALEAGTVIGKAMEDFNANTATVSGMFVPTNTNLLPTPKDMVGTITAFVHTSYYDPYSLTNDLSDLNISANLTLHPEASESGLVQFPFLLKDSAGQSMSRVLFGAQAVIANISAGAIQAQEIATNTLTVGGKTIQELIAQVVHQEMSKSGASQSLATQHKADGSENLMITLGSTASTSALSTLTITDRHQNTIASIDEQGNATFAGTLTAQNAHFDHVDLNDASISGVLYANQINGLKDRVAAMINDTFHFSPIASSASEFVANIAVTDNTIMERIAALESGTIASSSGYLASASFGDIQASGTGDFGNVIARSALSVGSTVLIDNTGISSAANVLNIQGNGQGSISLLAGAMTLDSTGLMVNTDAYFAKSVTIKEDLMVDVIKSLNGDIAIHLATPSSNLSDRLAIMNNQTQEVASIDASGFAKFNKLIIASDKEDPSATATVSGQYTTNASTGESMLVAGALQIKIESPKVGMNSLVYVTPTSSTNNQVLYVSSKHVSDPSIPGDTSYFIISIDNPIAIPVKFNWWIIN